MFIFTITASQKKEYSNFQVSLISHWMQKKRSVAATENTVFWGYFFPIETKNKAYFLFTIDLDHPSPFPYSYSLKVYGTLMACLLKGLQSQIKGINKNHDLYQIFSLNNVIYPKIERFKLRYTVN